MLNPLMLLGLLGLSVPVVLHLIQRQKLQPRLLATLRFLDAGDVANAFQMVPRDILQLLLRLLLLGVFVFLMARFTTGSSRTGTRALAIVLDQSMSMQRKADNGKMLFDQQKAEIADLIKGMNADDRFSLLLVGDTLAAETGFLRDKTKLQEALARFTVTEGGGRALGSAIERALRQLQSRKELNTAVLVFSDHQKSSLDPKVYAKTFQSLLRDGRVRLFLMGRPLKDSSNVAVEDASFSPRQVYLGTAGKLTATVRNLTDDEKTVDVYFREGETAGENRTLTLQPRETARIDLAHTFESPADAACSVSISEDVLAADNAFYAPMRVRDRRQVLLVTPPRERTEEDVRASYAGADLLAYALNPGEALGQSVGTFISVKRITPNLLERVSLPIYSTVILYGLGDLPDKSLADLSAYVKNGGGLCFIPTRAISPVRFNDTFAPVLGGLRLGGLKEPAEATFIDKNEAGMPDPLLLPLVRGEWGDIEDISFGRYFGTESRGKAACVLQGANGDLLAAVAPLGRGAVYVQTFSCEVADGSLPRSSAFVPMVQEIMGRMGGRRDPVDDDVIRVNEVYRMHLPELRGLSGDVQLAGPEKRDFALSQRDSARIESLSRAGSYKVSHAKKKGMRPRWLSVNAAAGESDLASLDRAEQDQLFGTVNIRRLAYGDLGAMFAHRREMFALMVALLLGAFIAEAALGAWQSLRKKEPNE